MQSNMLMLSWVVGALPTSRSQALLSSAGSVGYAALRQSLSSHIYPQHTILLTNVDVRDVPATDNHHSSDAPPSAEDVGDIHTTENLSVLESNASSSSPPDSPRTSRSEKVVHNGVVPIADNATPDASEDVGEPYSRLTRVEDWRNPRHICALLNTPLYFHLSDSTYDHSFHRFRADTTECGIAIAAASAPRILFSNVAEIPAKALYKCTAVTTVDFGGMCNVGSFGRVLLSHCFKLKYVNFNGLTDVAEIPSMFMQLCRAVKVINLAPFTNVSRINSSFLYGCTILESIDLTPLANITEIPDEFLSACVGLATIDFTPLTKVTRLGRGVLRGCSSLTCINLHGLEGVTTIPHDFLQGCSKLTTVDYTPMRHAAIEAPPQ